MPTMKVGAIGGYEEEDLKRQIAMAQALRNKSLETPGEMVGGYYVGKNPFLNLGEAVIGGLSERAAVGQQGTLEQSRQQAEQEWLARQPGATMQQTKELAGPTEGGEPLMGTAEVPKPYQQLQQEVQQWGTQAPATSQLGQQVRAHALTQALSLPEKQMIAEQKAEEKKQERLEKAANEAKAIALKAEEDRRRDRERAQDAERLARITASLKPPREPSKPATIETDAGVLQWDGKAWTPVTVGGKAVQPKAGKGGKAGPDLESAADLAQTGINLIDSMVGKRDAEGKLVPGSKPHPGFGTYVGATLLPGLRFIEGGDTATFEGMEKQVKGQAMLEAYQAIRGTGAISNKEGETATAALNRMNKAISEAEYVRAATEFRNILQKGVDRYKKGIKAPDQAVPGAPAAAGGVRTYNPATGEFE